MRFLHGLAEFCEEGNMRARDVLRCGAALLFIGICKPTLAQAQGEGAKGSAKVGRRIVPGFGPVVVVLKDLPPPKASQKPGQIHFVREGLGTTPERYQQLKAEAARRAKELRAKTPPEELRSEEHTSELQSLRHLVCRLLLEKKK